jgi:hypothetical protein
MSVTSRLLRIFASSPREVASECQTIKIVVDEINIWSTKALGFSFELIGSQTHTHPDFGRYPQDVINRQIADDYDIFIGIMGQRFGTPTDAAGSGTEEEFNRALERWLADRNSVTIMFYFKDEPLKISQLDISQITLVRDFRKRVGERGGYYRSFESTLEFERLIRLHLILLLFHYTGIQASARLSLGSTSPAKSDAFVMDAAFSERLRQYVTHIIDGNCGIVLALKEVVMARDVITASLCTLSNYASNMSAANGKKLPQESVVLAATLSAQSRFMDMLISDFAISLNMGVTELSKAVLLAAPFLSGTEGQIKVALNLLKDFPESMATNRSLIEKARNSIAKLPTEISQLGGARTALLRSLDTFIAELRSAEKICAELVSTIRSVIE